MYLDLADDCISHSMDNITSDVAVLSRSASAINGVYETDRKIQPIGAVI